MQVKEMMTANPACCTPETNLQEVAQMMVDQDCGCIPVVESQESMQPVGVVTDRDICCRTVAAGKNPLELTAGDCMSSPVVTVAQDADVDACCQVMEQHQIRRVPVVDERGACCGMVAQADVARQRTDRRTGNMVERISEPNDASSRVVGGASA